MISQIKVAYPSEEISQHCLEVEFEFLDLEFTEERKPQNKNKNPCRKARRISQKLDPLSRATTGLYQTSDTLMGGELSHRCTIPTHQTTYFSGEVGLKQKAIMLVKDKRNICSSLQDRERIGLASALAYHSVSQKNFFFKNAMVSLMPT